MVTIKKVYSYFSKDEFFANRWCKLVIFGDKLSYGDPEVSWDLIKEGEEWIRIKKNRDKNTILKKYKKESDACHDYVLFDLLNHKLSEEIMKIEYDKRHLFDIHEQSIFSIDNLYEVFHLFGCPNKYLSSDKNPQVNTIIIDVSLDKIVVDVFRSKRMNICTLEGTLNDFSMRLWVIVSLFWKLMEHKQDLQEIGIIGDDYSDSDILNFLKV
jgi:hypothetical protein